jgi:hypothetical protein
MKEMECQRNFGFGKSRLLYVCFLGLLLLLGGSTALGQAVATGPTAPAVTPDSAEILQARKVLKKKLERNPGIKKIIFHNEPEQGRYIEYTDSDHVQRVVQLFLLLPETINASFSPGSAVTRSAWKVSYTEFVQMHEYYWLHSNWKQSDAEDIARELKVLTIDARQHWDADAVANLEKFKMKCQSWRSVQAGNPMPEEARRHKLLGETAYREKNLDKATDEYFNALEIYPCWPEGQFNIAYMLGETGWYPSAVGHMRKYLELVPDAPDAQAARDKIALWQGKASGR